MSDIQEQIKKIISENKVILFMKGNKTAPQCGFSAKVVSILDTSKVEYQTVDVLLNGAVREGIKAFSNWPTIPQLYVSGEFIGGCDIISEMDENGELKELFSK